MIPVKRKNILAKQAGQPPIARAMVFYKDSSIVPQHQYNCQPDIKKENAYEKAFAMALVIVTVMACYSMAFATTFTRTAQCVNETDYVSSVNSLSPVSGKAVRIKYNAQGCSNSYSNHFKVMSTDGVRQFGSKFVLPVQEYPMTCGVSLTKDNYYRMDMRGNTKYKAEGLTSVVLAGWFLLNS